MARNPIPGRLNRESNPVPGSMAGFNPQFYDADGHAIDVDVNNPYPVGNYIKQGNLWLPVSSDNPMPTKDNEIKQKIEELNQKVEGIIDGSTPANTQLTGRKVKLRRVFESIDETVSAGEDIAVTIQPTEGYMITGVVNLYLYAEGIPTATEGTHRFEIKIGTPNLIYDEVAIMQTNHNNPIFFRSWQESSNVVIHPVGKDAFISIVKNIHATKSLPFILRYRNNTDGDQTGSVLMSVFLKEEAVIDD